MNGCLSVSSTVELALEEKVKDQCSIALAVLGHKMGPKMGILQEAPYENKTAFGINIYDNHLATHNCRAQSSREERS